jgi:outer membrane lipoprotein-sorting protein
MSAAAVQFLLGEGELTRDFEISALSCASDVAELKLVPKAAASYEKMHVLLDRTTGDLRRTTVFFVLGNVTEVVFSNIETNRDPAPTVFRLELPADVRVIDLKELNEPTP